MPDLNLGTGKITAGSASIAGLNISSAFLPAPIAKTNEWMSSPIAGAPTTSNSLVQSGLYLTPIVFPDAAALITLAANVTVAAGGTPGTFSRIVLSLYADDLTGHSNPAGLLVDSSTITTLSVLTTGRKTVTISETLPAPGLYWLGFVWQTDYTSPTSPTVSAFNNGLIQLPTSSATPESGASPAGYLQTGITSALPNPAVAARTGVSLVPRVTVQHA